MNNFSTFVPFYMEHKDMYTIPEEETVKNWVEKETNFILDYDVMNCSVLFDLKYLTFV
jgi:hypothetical protein